MEKDVAIPPIWTYLSIDAGWHFLNMRPQPGTGESGTTKVDHGGDLAKRFRSRGRTSTTTMNPLPQNRHRMLRFGQSASFSVLATVVSFANSN